MTTFHSLTVAKVEPETRDAVTITFAVPPALQDAYRFRPGQHLTLKAQLAGTELRRCYSICRSLNPGEISVAVKAIEGGRFSHYARDEIKQGMALEVMVPQGHFSYQPQPQRHGRYLAIAAGSGITPMLAILSATLQTETASEFTLIYGNRSSQSMMFRQALADLKDKYPQRLQLVCIFSQETMDSDLLHGRIDGEKLTALATHLVDYSQFDEAFICGPAAMMDEAEATLKALGMPEKGIHLERFNTPGTAVKRTTSVQAQGQKVTVRQDGRDREITLSADDESILDAALRQGADLPYACKGGVCATCKCKVVRGKVDMVTNYSLEPDELAAGYVLSCQALPLTSDVVVDFDAKGMA
ncbi:phenylacetic acid degradation protein [Citrobacter sp. NCU1]|uniref:1,2-phenylacetyl-CoA epoxidase subunit PaaE n=1 Tax=Citrobacter sp. NCU1 TaxID=2026683 RepID=UPI00139099A6|nr:1,2-phenylacetyl-CoA epoxidase subunit PaaE [Citrobacter sp. NCU1]NDO82165.1 phenylacetic acid degradation protein [Citrobacter sp. NCU1]